jgi:hypothetical protein
MAGDELLFALMGASDLVQNEQFAASTPPSVRFGYGQVGYVAPGMLVTKFRSAQVRGG